MCIWSYRILFYRYADWSTIMKPAQNKVFSDRHFFEKILWWLKNVPKDIIQRRELRLERDLEQHVRSNGSSICLAQPVTEYSMLSKSMFLVLTAHSSVISSLQ